MDAALLHSLQTSQRLGTRVAEAFVSCDRRALAGRLTVLTQDRCLDRDHFALEPARIPRSGGVLLRGDTKGVYFFPGDTAVVRDALCRLKLSLRGVPRPLRSLEESGAVHDVCAERNAAHGLNSAGDTDVDGPGSDQSGDEMARLLARSALGVHGCGSDFKGLARSQPGVASNVVGLLTGLGDTASDDLLNHTRLYASPLDYLKLRHSQELSRMESCQPPFTLADRRTHRLDNHWLGHFIPSRSCCPIHAPSSVGSALSACGRLAAHATNGVLSVALLLPIRRVVRSDESLSGADTSRQARARSASANACGHREARSERPG